MWLQGCTLGCPGCFNPETHPPRCLGEPIFDRQMVLAGLVQGMSILAILTSESVKMKARRHVSTRG